MITITDPPSFTEVDPVNHSDVRQEDEKDKDKNMLSQAKKKNK